MKLNVVLWNLNCRYTQAWDISYAGGTRDICPHEKNPEQYFGYRKIIYDDNHRPYNICIVLFPHARISGINYNGSIKEAEYGFCRNVIKGELAPFEEAQKEINFTFVQRLTTWQMTFEEVKTHFGNRSLTIDSGFSYIWDEEPHPEEMRNGQEYHCERIIVNWTPSKADGVFEMCIEAYENGTYFPNGKIITLRTARNCPKLRKIITTPRPLSVCEYYVFKPGEPIVAKTVLCKDRPKDLIFSCTTFADRNCRRRRIWECTFRAEYGTCYQFYNQIIEEAYHGGHGIRCTEEKYDPKYNCTCPCKSSWMEWSLWSASCGIATRLRLRPRINQRSSDCEVPNKDKCCEQHDEKVFDDFCEDYIPNTNISLRTAICANGIKSRDIRTKRYFCDCFSGFTGLLCEQSIDSCASNPCKHGRCTNVGNHYHCSCSSGYEGINCDISMLQYFEGFEQCGPYRLCMNGGNCTKFDDGMRCQCPKKWGGKYCEEKNQRLFIGNVEMKRPEVEAEIIGSNKLLIALCCVAILLVFLLIISFIVVRIARARYRNRWRGKTTGTSQGLVGLALFNQGTAVQTREVQGQKEEMQQAMGVSLAEKPRNNST
ncbi:EGF domain containing protein [Trichuris trichiura]|uniref:EGF domain containing protein n=1 Tax=Trichuris trichiura TaxID=36087 RepID=A0A077Z8T3_TRITR|nr:EGF domain containing protein [Trichuris trichiura]